MKKVLKSLFLIFLLLIANAFSYIKSHEITDPVKAELLLEEDSIQPGRPFWVAIHLEIEPEWHTYWKNPGAAGMPLEVSWHLPEGFKTSPLHWPTPQKFTALEATGYGYEKEALFLVEITPPSKIINEVDIEAEISWVVCDSGSCLPGSATIQTKLPMKNELPKAHAQAPHFSKARAALPQPGKEIQATLEKDHILLTLAKGAKKADFFPEKTDQIDTEKEIAMVDSSHLVLKTQSNAGYSTLQGILVLDDSEAYEVNIPLEVSSEAKTSFIGFLLVLGSAFLGGLILNVMPCVLPVISFKILSFIKMAGQSRRLILKHGLAFCLGVLISFWTLATLLILLRAWGHAVGLGFQFQEPLFVSILAAIVFIFGLSLFGVFELGTGVAAIAGQASQKNHAGLASSFFSGILATAVATPCTGPFLGPAVGLAMALPPVKSLLIFTFLGLGMSFPYLLMGAFPSLLRYMPKPGNWMVIFKEIMGFIMMATVLWLTWVFSALTDSLAVSLLLASFFIMAFGCWIYGTWGTPLKKKTTRTVSLLLFLAMLGTGGYILVQASSLPPEYAINPSETEEIAMADPIVPTDVWIPFSAEKLASLREQGVPVFVDFTAKWCLICQTNKMVLHLDDVSAAFKEQGVVRMIADWTKKDAEIAKELEKHGRSGVPLYLFYGDKEEPLILPQVLTTDTVIEAVKKHL